MPERILSEIVELDIDRCQNTFGVDPCTAGRLQSGDAQAGARQHLTLSTLASAVADAYNGKTLRLADARERVIADYGKAEYVDLPPTSGNSVSTPHTAANAITGDVEIVVKIAMDDWTPAAAQTIIGKRLSGAADTAYVLRLQSGSTGLIELYVASGATFYVRPSTAAPSIADGQALWLKANIDVDNGSSQHEVRYYTSSDYDPYTRTGTWTQLGGTVTAAGALVINSAAQPLRIGKLSDDTQSMGGNVYYAEVRNGINGPAVAIFDASDADAGATSLVSTQTGETWTVHQSGSPMAELLGFVRRADVDKRWQQNHIRNAGSAGVVAGSPGTAPTYWTVPNPVGLTRTIVAAGYDADGHPHLDVRYVGTGDGNAQYFNVESLTIIPAAQNQQWAFSFHIALLAGSNANVTWSAVLASTNSDASQTTIHSGTFTPTGTKQRVERAGTMSNALTQWVRPFFSFLPANGQAVDFTVRVAGPSVEKAASAGEFLDTTGAKIVEPTASTAYTIIDRPNACYNTFRTCVDKPNYLKGTQTIKFTGTGSPVPKGQGVRPYIKRLATAPTEIDPEEGLAVRASSTITLVDEACADTEFDAYIASRAAAARGTFWTRLLARNLNYAGRPARVKRAFVAAGVWGATTTERFIIESIKGPNAGGEVQLTLKDPIKLADRGKAPVPTTGKLSLPLLINDLSMTLYAGEGAQYATNGHVRIGDEIIQFTGRSGDVLSWPDGTYRAKFGTAAADAAVDDVVQQCLVYTDQAFSAVIEDLLNRAGIADADIDLAQLAAEEATWLGDDFRVTAVITDPEDIADLIKELLQQSNSVMWWSPTEQKVKFKVYAPQSPAEIGAVALDDTAHVVENSVATERLEAERITRAAIYFDLRTPIDDIGEAKNFKTGEIAVDTDAEGPNEYNEARPRTIYSRWFGPANTQAMRNLVRRYVARYRDAPERIEFTLDPKDGAHKEGDVLDLETRWLVDESGAVRTARILITRREPHGVDVKYAARVTNFDRPYGFIAPNGTPDYPNNNGYACVSDNNGRMSDGSQGYLII